MSQHPQPLVHRDPDNQGQTRFNEEVVNTMRRVATSVESLQTTGALAVNGKLIAIRNLTSGTTYTPTAGTVSIYVEAVGGGGGGGGATFSSPNMGFGAGGAGGAYAAKWYATVAYKAFTILIGTAGAGGANTGATGTAGGDSTFTDNVATTLTAKGGGGGTGQTAGTTTAAPLGGTGNLSTGGDINGYGDCGANSVRFSGTTGSSGGGGCSPWGGGGRGKNINGAGNFAFGFGGGGGGASAVTASQVGGDGSAGMIRVWEFS